MTGIERRKHEERLFDLLAEKIRDKIADMIPQGMSVSVDHVLAQAKLEFLSSVPALVSSNAIQDCAIRAVSDALSSAKSGWSRSILDGS